jgi:hypothetical protein
MTLDPDSANGDRVEHAPKDAPRLVTAQDIARSRIDAMRGSPRGDSRFRMMQWFNEIHRAKLEKARGEWTLL